MPTQFSLFDYLPILLQGAWTTLYMTIVAMAVATPAAVGLALSRSSGWKAVRFVGGSIIEFFKGSSALVQLFWAFYALPLVGINLTPFTAAILVLGLNEGSYMSEAVRVAFKAVPAGQREASIALHLPPSYRFFHITLPQALPLMIPPFGNALINMLKFTALASVVTIQELTSRAGQVRNILGESIPVYAFTLMLYFGMALVLGFLVKILERHANARVGQPTAPLLGITSNVPLWAVRRGL